MFRLVQKKGITDARFNPNSILTADYEEREERWTAEGYEKFLRANKMDDKNHWWAGTEANYIKNNENNCKADLHSCFIHGTEYLMPKVFCCLPLSSYSQWMRYDHIIDYVEETTTKRGSVNRVKVLKEAIYPYIDYWDNRDGRLVKSIYACAFRRFINAGQKHYNDGGYELARLCGFESSEACAEHMKPAVPELIQYQLEYGEVFKEPETVYSMLPMIYVYWS